MFFMFCIFVEGVVALFLLVYCKFETRVILNVILNSNTCFVSPDRLTRTRTHLTFLDKTIQCIVNPELSVKRMGCTAFKRNASQIWSHGFFGPSAKKKENQALGARCGAIWRSFKICVRIPSPPSAGARVIFAGTYAQMLAKFPFYTLDKKSPRFLWFARDFYGILGLGLWFLQLCFEKKFALQIRRRQLWCKAWKGVVGWVHVALCKLRG